MYSEEVKVFDLFRQSIPPPDKLAVELKALRPNDRRMKCDELVATGHLQIKDMKNEKRKRNPGLETFVYNDGTAFPYQKCIACGFYVSAIPGGHKTVHSRRECLKKYYGSLPHFLEVDSTSSSYLQKDDMDFDSTDHSVPTSSFYSAQTDTKSPQIIDTVVKYCLTSGTSFEDVSNDSFRELITRISRIGRASDYENHSIKLPRVSEMEAYCEEFRFPQMFKIFGENVSEYVRNRAASIFIDDGKHVRNCISAFIVYVKTGPGDAYKIELCPLGFIPKFCIRGGKSLKDWILECAERLAISEEEILALNVNMDSKMSMDGFANCDRTGISSIDKLPNWILNPTELTETKLSDDEQHELELCREFLDDVYSAAQWIGSDESVKSEFPTWTAEFQLWPSYRLKLQHAQQIFAIQNDLHATKNGKNFEDIDWSLLADIESIFDVLEPFFQAFEKNDVNIHRILPKFNSLNEHFKNQDSSGNSSKSKLALWKSAQLVLMLFWEREISDLHYKTTMLSPGHRRLSRLDPSAKQRAIKLIRKELETVPEGPQERKEAKKDEEELLDADINDEYDDPMEPRDDELSAYLDENTTNRDEPLVFWSRRRISYPKLSQVAFRCFSQVSSRNLIKEAFESVERISGEQWEGITEKRIFATFLTDSCYNLHF